MIERSASALFFCALVANCANFFAYVKNLLYLCGRKGFDTKHKDMIITTTPTIEGHTIKEYKGLVSGEVIFGMNFLKDIGASLRDFFGGRTSLYEQDMLEERETAQKEMAERARQMGANAIIGVSFGYETMGQANGMIMISISGTAVVID